jgi:hypothetical protein
VSRTRPKRPPARTRKTGPSRELIVAIAVTGLVVVVAVAIVIARMGGSQPQTSSTPSALPLVSIPPPPSPAPAFVAAPKGTLPKSLAYVQVEPKRTVLNQIDLATGKITELFATPGQSGIFASPNGDTVAYVMVRTASGKEVPAQAGREGTRVIHVRNLQTGADVEVGEGSRPGWSWDGTHLAAYQSTPQGVRVVAMTLADPHLRPVTPPGPVWTILGWADDRLLLFGYPLRLYTAGLDGTLEQIPSPDATTRDPSPDGRWIFSVSHQGDAVFQPLGTRDTVVIDLGPWQLGQSYWTRNDLVVVAAATGTEIDAPSAVLVLDPATGSMLEVPNTQGAVAAFPAPDGASFVLARGKFPPIWKLWTCRLSGDCTRSGDVRIGVALVRAG